MITFKSVLPEMEADLRETRPVKLRGLCAICEHAPYCTYPRDPARPVQQCEEFDDGLQARLEATRQTRMQDVAGAVEPEPEAALSRGLCRNCDLRETCTFPRPRGGVWHCDEYR